MDIVYKLALSDEEKKQAATIVKKEYQRSGYVSEETGEEEKITSFISLSTTKIFLAYDASDNTPLATVSVIVDSPLGLPLDELYQNEVDLLRKRHMKLAEISQLSLDSDAVTQRFGEKSPKRNLIILPLFKLVLHACLAQEINALCIAINPKHAVFYDAIGFQTIGDLKYYSSFNQAPAIAKILDLTTLDTLKTKNAFLYRAIVLSPPDTSVLSGRNSLLHSL